MKSFKLLVNGELVAGAGTMDVINPATGAALTECPRASQEQVDQAVAAARGAFPAWAARTTGQRGALLSALADAVDAHAEELARLLTQEQGKPLAEARGEVGYASHFIRYFASCDLPPRTLLDQDGQLIEMHRRPLGVVAAIIPWNFPLLIVAFKLPPALLAGNTIVIKPAPTTPLTTLLFGELCREIFPAGVVNIVTDQNDHGGYLASHPDVAKISFTGSTSTGRKVMMSAASGIKRVTLELGGNDAGIVLDDVEPARVAKDIFNSAFMNCGQVCIALKRLYVHDSVYDPICEELIRLAETAVVDDGLAQGAEMGPLQNKAQYEKVAALIEEARAEGARVHGGDMIDRPGYFIRPAIVSDVTDGCRLVDEEQFGPVLPVIRFTDPEDALRRANASIYGLGGSIWSSDPERAKALALRMEAGTVWINKHLDFGPGIPFAGAKQSGLGTEFAEEGLAEFTQIQIINAAI